MYSIKLHSIGCGDSRCGLRRKGGQRNYRQQFQIPTFLVLTPVYPPFRHSLHQQNHLSCIRNSASCVNKVSGAYVSRTVSLR